jgi:hypothetical protein
MGLDITLHSRAECEQNERHDREWNALWGRKERGEITEQQYEELCKGIPPWASATSVPSERHPDHLCSRRYLRSSYGEGGFNRSVLDMTGQDHGFYWIFEPLGREWGVDEVELTAADIPALREAQKRAEEVAGELRRCDPLRATKISALFGAAEHLWGGPPTTDEALRWARDELGREPAAIFDSYSTGKGAVFKSGLEVLAVTVGRDILGSPAAILVCRLDPETVEHYVATAEIAAEFCEEAIGLIEREFSCRLSWSG